jgi:hypothetical protein
MFNLKHGTMIAIAAGSLFAAACKKSEEKKSETPPAASETKKDEAQVAPADKPAAEGEKTAKVHCQGINECKGKGGCKSAANECAGKNGCKGQGFVDMNNEEECKTKGGTVMASSGM